MVHAALAAEISNYVNICDFVNFLSISRVLDTSIGSEDGSQPQSITIALRLVPSCTVGDRVAFVFKWFTGCFRPSFNGWSNGCYQTS